MILIVYLSIRLKMLVRIYFGSLGIAVVEPQNTDNATVTPNEPLFLRAVQKCKVLSPVFLITVL